jgi:hypothetical protein
MSKYKIGDRVKYTYESGDPSQGWFGAEIVDVDQEGRYTGQVFDIGEGSVYATPGFYGVHMGDDTNLSLTPWVEPSQNPYPAVIGRAPVKTPPKLVGPFEAVGSRVQDAEGREVALIDSPVLTWNEDIKVSEVIALALNQYFQEDK